MVLIQTSLILPIILALILGLAHFWNEKIFFKKESLAIKSRSFIAGASVSYIFLFLLPDLYEGVTELNQWIFVFILLGFSLVHFFEKYFYQHTKGEERLLKFKEIHYIVFLFYYFLLGVILINFLGQSLLKGALFFAPILFYASVSKISFAEVNIHIRELKILRLLLSLSALFGVFASGLILNYAIFYNALLSLVVGAFLYIAIMDFMPKESRGRPEYFLLGAGVYTLFIFLNTLL